MLDIKFVRENPDAVKENIRKKFQDAKLPLVDEVIALDAQYRKCLQEAENLKAQRNKLSKANGPLFGQLKKFSEDQTTYEKSKYFWIFTPEKDYRYEIISAYTTGVNSDTYTLFKGPGDEFQEYLDTIKGYSEIETDDTELTIKDRIVTLSTCTGNDATRYVVQGRLADSVDVS